MPCAASRWWRGRRRRRSRASRDGPAGAVAQSEDQQERAGDDDRGGRWKLPDTGRTLGCCPCRMSSRRSTRSPPSPACPSRPPPPARPAPGCAGTKPCGAGSPKLRPSRGCEAPRPARPSRAPTCRWTWCVTSCGAPGPWPEQLDPVGAGRQRVVLATAETEHIGPMVLTAPLQALARLHTAAAAPLTEAPARALGRPRQAGEECAEFVTSGLPPNPRRPTSASRGLSRCCSRARGVPTVVVAAVVHAEIAHARPFARANGAVARALERAVLKATGLDPTGVVVPEAGHGAQGAGLPRRPRGIRHGVARRGRPLARPLLAGHRRRRRGGPADLRCGARRPPRLSASAAAVSEKSRLTFAAPQE